MRSDTFTLIGGVGVYGGFAGSISGPQLRDWPGYNKTILSGDIGNASVQDNSYHVVTGADGAVLDGFTITGGNADGSSESSYGGGIYCYLVSPTIRNCVITVNKAKGGGGGMYIYYCSPTLTNCFFIDNEAIEGGGGIYSWRGAGPVLTNCVFSGNKATEHVARGGGIYAENKPKLINCTFSKNEAKHSGGGIGMRGGGSSVTNCIFWENCDGPSCENYDESAQIYGSAVVNYSCIQGWTGGGQGNFGGDPVADNPDFVKADTPAGDDTYFGTFDDGLRLQTGSPCIDAANGNFAPSTDICGYNHVDISGVANGAGEPDYVDMGAYESGPTVVVMCWIDESLPGSGEQNYNPDEYARYRGDLANYRNLIDSDKLLVVKSGCLVPVQPCEGCSCTIADVLPEEESPPWDISIEEFPRTSPEPTLTDFTNHFERICDGVVPDYLCLSVDNSPSLRTGVIEPHYSEALNDNFIWWIGTYYPGTDIKRRDGMEGPPEFTNERWVDEMKIQVQSVIDGL